ncbi:imidazolonepropionase [Haliangium sp.]|uniref:imidazolonepropionase n=1 Tax=Haliangium sp. TaxID=2663208 RepID=UPI003D0F6710
MNPPRIDSIEVIRAGTALALTLAGGRSLIRRRIDLAPVLGSPAPMRTSPRFASAEVMGERVRLGYTGGGEEHLSAAAVLEPEPQATLVIEGAGRLVTADGPADDPLGVIPDGALIARAGRVLWVGRSGELDRAGVDLGAARRVHAGGRLVTPGLVDCHAHPVFAGDRAAEFGHRAAGREYRDIARAGGGIMATVGPTRAASFADLVALTAARMDRALAAGTTTCEAKSGYDLTVAGELRLLEVAWAVDGLQPVDLVPTLLGAHVLPPEHTGGAGRADYVRAVAEQMIPQAAARGLAGAVDVYCDEGAFTADETRCILEAGRAAGMHLRAHVGQFADLGGAELVAELDGLSVDHLEQVSAAGIAALAARGVIAVMLPGACVQLRQSPPPVAALRSAGVALAVASDMNPGTSMCETLPIQMWLATTHYGMTVPEAWLGVTRVAAQALGRSDIGRLAQGTRADLVIWDAEHPAEIPYRYGAVLAAHVIKDGRTVYVGGGPDRAAAAQPV